LDEICVRDCSENPFLICLFGEAKKIAAKGATRQLAGNALKIK